MFNFRVFLVFSAVLVGCPSDPKPTATPDAGPGGQTAGAGGAFESSGAGGDSAGVGGDSDQAGSQAGSQAGVSGEPLAGSGGQSERAGAGGVEAGHGGSPGCQCPGKDAGLPDSGVDAGTVDAGADEDAGAELPSDTELGTFNTDPLNGLPFWYSCYTAYKNPDSAFCQTFYKSLETRQGVPDCSDWGEGSVLLNHSCPVNQMQYCVSFNGRSATPFSQQLTYQYFGDPAEAFVAVSGPVFNSEFVGR